MSQTTEEKLKKYLGDKLVLNEPLDKYTTFKIGGSAKYFYVAKTKEDLIEALKAVKRIKLPYFILGKGSNILVSDQGFNGLAIKAENNKIEKRDDVRIYAEAGVSVQELLQFTLKNDLTGIEFLSGVPGTVGGAVCMNAKATFLGFYYKKPQSLSSFIEDIEVLTPKGEVEIHQKDYYKFKFGSSNIPNKKHIVLSVIVRLEKGVSIQAREYIEDYAKFRKGKQPLNMPNAGSIFQNPLGESAGRLIDRCGLRGKQIGGAKISEKHANFIVNTGNAKAQDVLELIKMAKKQVKEKFGANLELEIKLIGFEETNSK